MTTRHVAKFSKVDLEIFCRDYKGTFLPGHAYELKDDEINSVYGAITLPTRATKHSAGYDFRSPIDFSLLPKETIKIPTGIRCKMESNIVLMIYPRSSLGFKYRMMLENTVGVIDSDYYDSDNEGHIFIKFTNHGDKEINVKAGEAFAQGIFTEYFLTVDDNVCNVRNGGLGSTNEL